MRQSRPSCGFRSGVLAVALLLAVAGVAQATNYALTTTVTTDGVPSTAGGTLDVQCRANSGSPWTSCGSTVAAGSQVSIWAVTAEGYWFMWFSTSPYLAGCTTTNWGWGYHANPEIHCAFTMPSSAASINAEFQLP